MSKIREILDELQARTCSLFGASLSDLEPEDEEAVIKAEQAIHQYMLDVIGEDEGIMDEDAGGNLYQDIDEEEAIRNQLRASQRKRIK